MKHLATLAVMVAVVAFMSPAVQAAATTIDATAEIVVSVTITNEYALVFGAFTAPTTGPATWVLNGTGLTETTTTDSEDLDLNDHSRGGFQINGDPGRDVTYSVGIASNFAAGLTLYDLTMDPSTQPGQLDGTGQLVVVVGGTLDIADTATPGNYSATINVTANY